MATQTISSQVFRIPCDEQEQCCFIDKVSSNAGVHSNPEAMMRNLRDSAQAVPDRLKPRERALPRMWSDTAKNYVNKAAGQASEGRTPSMEDSLNLAESYAEQSNTTLDTGRVDGIRDQGYQVKKQKIVEDKINELKGLAKQAPTDLEDSITQLIEAARRHKVKIDPRQLQEVYKISVQSHLLIAQKYSEEGNLNSMEEAIGFASRYASQSGNGLKPEVVAMLRQAGGVTAAQLNASDGNVKAMEEYLDLAQRASQVTGQPLSEDVTKIRREGYGNAYHQDMKGALQNAQEGKTHEMDSQLSEAFEHGQKADISYDRVRVGQIQDLGHATAVKSLVEEFQHTKSIMTNEYYREIDPLQKLLKQIEGHENAVKHPLLSLALHRELKQAAFRQEIDTSIEMVVGTASSVQGFGVEDTRLNEKLLSLDISLSPKQLARLEEAENIFNKTQFKAELYQARLCILPMDEEGFMYHLNRVGKLSEKLHSDAIVEIRDLKIEYLHYLLKGVENLLLQRDHLSAQVTLDRAIYLSRTWSLSLSQERASFLQERINAF